MMMFTTNEADLLRSQSVISKPAGRGGRLAAFAGVAAALT